MGYNKNNSKGMPKHSMSQDHKMAYDRSEISRLKKDIHYDDLKKKSMGPAAYGKMEQGPLNGNAFGHAMQKAGGNYDKAKAMLENEGPAKHGEMHDSPMSMGGSFMSKHASNSYFHKKNLLDDMPIDDHASGPLKQTAKDEQNVLDSRQKNINYHKKAEGDFYNKVKDYTPSSQEEIDKINKKLTDLNKNTNLRVNRYNKSLDSIKSVRKQKFDDLFK